MKNLFLVVFLMSAASSAYAATCTFTGGGDGTSWTDAGNWSCGSVPNPSSDDIIIPAGQNVINDGSYDVAMDNGFDLSIFGSLDMGDAKIEISQPGSVFTMGSAAVLNNTKELFIVSNGVGNVAYGAQVDVKHLKVDDDGVFTINSCTFNITDKLEVLSSGRIIGGGKINYGGSSGNYVNNGNGIYGCTDPALGGCDMGTCSVILPIELVEFEATQLTEETIAISWKTISESNNEYFTLERMTETGWHVVANVEGAGNSQSTLEYNIVDRVSDVSYVIYRLKQTDFDGKHSYSDMISVQMSEVKKLQAYPNPTVNSVTISGIDSFSNFAIFDASNKEVTNNVSITTNGNGIELNLTSLQSGLYIIRANDQVVRISKM